MNVRPDDLAVVVSGPSANLGKLVRVHYPAPSTVARLIAWVMPEKGAVWWTCEALCSFSVQNWGPPIVVHPGELLDVSDRDLRPLRDRPGKDETLDWASVPDPQVTRLLKLLHEAAHD